MNTTPRARSTALIFWRVIVASTPRRRTSTDSLKDLQRRIEYTFEPTAPSLLNFDDSLMLPGISNRIYKMPSAMAEKRRVRNRVDRAEPSVVLGEGPALSHRLLPDSAEDNNLILTTLRLRSPLPDHNVSPTDTGQKWRANFPLCHHDCDTPDWRGLLSTMPTGCPQPCQACNMTQTLSAESKDIVATCQLRISANNAALTSCKALDKGPERSDSESQQEALCVPK